jgi:DNA-binding response OmpR family regulator
MLLPHNRAATGLRRIVLRAEAGALGWLARNTGAIALLDVVLRDGVCLELARTLKQRGVPFAVYSGLPVSRDRPSELQDVPWLEKPVSREALAAILIRLASTTDEVARDQTEGVGPR